MLQRLGTLPLGVMMVLVTGGGVVAGIGFVDDHGHVSARWRLLAHVAAAVDHVWYGRADAAFNEALAAASSSRLTDTSSRITMSSLGPTT